ncbi:MAG: hypothetical protein A3H51_02975 [Candidatus Spechtbacteria bacterium RIFCSPLOWO2_02_FULL_38_8]|uniref:DNA-directed DNA polymerase n=1 Tax=Candidatus Spechtbacteria bacterium RIFCSPLOWO2_02_FULL_38_8 TaxID=1802164 RepID=A0A1G2HML4_9BACT|nr:MAG: hypothetical protein A3H51_02975 [Candidatus Spechtbacteria bacterium RIFCSPLOWO2_02_FULL_38_8]
MLIILHGEDTFRSRQKLKELQKTYLEKNKRSPASTGARSGFSAGGGPPPEADAPLEQASGWNFEKYDAAGLTFQELKGVLEAQSLFAQKRFVVVENILENNDLVNELRIMDYELRSSTDIVVLYERTNVTKDADYKKVLEQADKVQEFKRLSQNEVVKYFVNLFPKIERAIIQKVLERGQSVGPAGRPAGRAGGKDFKLGVESNTMWQIHNELSKLRTYKKEGIANDHDLDLLQVGTTQAQIFSTIDAIFQKNSDKAFYNLLLHWQGGEHPQVVFNMIEMQLKNIALVKEVKEVGRVNTEQLDVHPYVVKKTLALIDKFSWDKLKNLYERVESLDIKNKTGVISTELACELLVAAIASGNK